MQENVSQEQLKQGIISQLLERKIDTFHSLGRNLLRDFIHHLNDEFRIRSGVCEDHLAHWLKKNNSSLTRISKLLPEQREELSRHFVSLPAFSSESAQSSCWIDRSTGSRVHPYHIPGTSSRVGYFGLAPLQSYERITSFLQQHTIPRYHRSISFTFCPECPTVTSGSFFLERISSYDHPVHDEGGDPSSWKLETTFDELCVLLCNIPLFAVPSVQERTYRTKQERVESISSSSIEQYHGDIQLFKKITLEEEKLVLERKIIFFCQDHVQDADKIIREEFKRVDSVTSYLRGIGKPQMVYNPENVGK